MKNQNLMSKGNKSERERKREAEAEAETEKGTKTQRGVYVHNFNSLYLYPLEHTLLVAAALSSCPLQHTSNP